MNTTRLNGLAIPSLVLLAAIAAQSCGGGGSETNTAAGPPSAVLTEVNVPGTTPMSATAVDLAAAGYAAREFYEFANAEASKYLLREGYAVAVVSAQRVGVERLKTWSPTRYAGLSVDVNACGADGTSGTTGTSLCTDDPLSFRS